MKCLLLPALIGLGLLCTAALGRTRYARDAVEGSGVEPSQEQQAIDQIKKVMEIAAAAEQEKANKKEDKDEDKKKEDEAAVMPAAPKNETKDDAVMEDMKKDQLIPVGGAAAAAAEKANTTATEAAIKEENVEKCNKCLKPGYKFRHDGFCGKCSSQGIIDPAEAQELTEAINCKKCLKPKYLARNENLCQNTCADEMAAAKKNQTAAAPAKPSSDFKFATTDMNPENDQKKDAVKVEMEDDEEEDEEENEEEEQVKEDAEPAQLELAGQPTEEEVELGPLGNLIKYLVVQNTFL